MGDLSESIESLFTSEARVDKRFFLNYCTFGNTLH